MPRFAIATRAELGDALEALGMPLAFDPDAADFSGIHVPESATDAIFIKNVIHQANIQVDEKGTEAAAATAVGMDTGGCTGPLPGKELTLRLDRPFLFVLRDVGTGAVVFMGRVVDPSITP
jgi:serpin B